MNRTGVRALLAVVIIAGAVVGAAPSVGAEVLVFTAHLLPSNEVPPVTNADQSAFGLAIVKLTVARDLGNNITGAVADFDIGLTRFPGIDTATGGHIHQGSADLNGPIVVDAGIVPFPLVGGDAFFAPPSVTVSSAIAAQIVVNPAGFYFDVHTSANPDGSVRGQLESSAAFAAVGLAAFTDGPICTVGELLALDVFFGNFGGPVQADVFAGLVLPPSQVTGICPGAGNAALLFFGPNNTFALECLATLASPGSHAIALARNITIPSLPLLRVSLLSMLVPPGTPLGTYRGFVCLANPNTFPGGQPRCDIILFDIAS